MRDYSPKRLIKFVEDNNLLPKRLSKFVRDNNLLPTLKFEFHKGLAACDALLSISPIPQGALDEDSEAGIFSLDFSTAFDCVNHSALIDKLRLLGIDGSFINILGEFLLSRTQKVCFDELYSGARIVLSNVPQGSVFGPLLFIICTSDVAKFEEQANCIC